MLQIGLGLLGEGDIVLYDGMSIVASMYIELLCMAILLNYKSTSAFI